MTGPSTVTWSWTLAQVYSSCQNTRNTDSRYHNSCIVIGRTMFALTAKVRLIRIPTRVGCEMPTGEVWPLRAHTLSFYLHGCYKG